MIQGNNPEINRQTEQTELKHGCMRWLLNTNDIGTFDLWNYGHDGSPHYNTGCDTMETGSRVKFFENALDWKNITYTFYPYFWGRKAMWKELARVKDADPLFQKFLQAGYARVVVPVTPGMEDIMMFFIATGQIRYDVRGVTINAPYAIAIANEFHQEVGDIDTSIKPWTVRIPTSLVSLQRAGAPIEETQLPCWGCENEAPHTGDTGTGNTSEGGNTSAPVQ